MSLRFALAISSAALGLTLVCSDAAEARVIAIDGDPSFVTPGCTLGVACSGITMPFSIITPAVTTDQIFIYRSGVVSLGWQLPLTASLGNVASLGHAFLAPGFGDFGAAPPTTYTTVVTEAFNAVAGAFRVTWAFPAIDDGAIFQVELRDLSLFPDPSDPSAPFLRDPTKVGNVEADFAYGDALDSWNGLTVATDPALPTGSIVGYGVGALNFSVKFGSDFSALSTTDYGVDLTGARPFGSGPGVPEPATWAILCLGFAGIGGALRRYRRRESLVAG